MFGQLESEAGSYVEMGTLAASRANFDEAIFAFSNAIDMDPQCLAAYKFRSYVYATRGEFAKAIDDLNVAIDMESESAELYQLRAGYQLRLLCFSEVILDTTMVMQLGGDEVDAYFRRGSAYLAAGDIERALLDLHRYVDAMGEA